MESDSDYAESTTITFEWTLKGIRNLFDSTKGDKKSKVTKSVRFGNNQWQILFYANAGQTKEGTEGGGYVSLYLCCEPTLEEKEAALGDSGRWIRDGVYKFSFELRSLGTPGPSTVYNSKEAQNHSFTWKTANWGWAQFARRDHVFYHSMPAKSLDAFLIICSITSSPSLPPAQTVSRQPVPKALLDTVGSLLNDHRYSDVQFIIPKRGQNISNGWKIWASKRILQRADYFQTMFNSNFAEGNNQPSSSSQTPKSMTQSLRRSPPQLNLILEEFEDSDDEQDDHHQESPRTNDQSVFKSIPPGKVSMLLSDSVHFADWDRIDPEASQSTDSHTESPEVTPTVLIPSIPQQDAIQNHSKMTVVVKDAAYSTYHAMLYYLYTDSIVFAPLSSSFLGSSNEAAASFVSSGDASIPSTPSEGSQVPVARQAMPNAQGLCASRAEWIREWMKNNPGRPAPCSAKSIYRIADRLDLTELKERAAKFITKSLAVENIAYEIFSPFAAAFEPIRKVEIEFFLSHWHEIRISNTMKDVWVQIRNGRHPGFEAVWPLIVQNLDFKPSSPDAPVKG